MSRDKSGARGLAGSISDVLADPLAWVFVVGGAAVAAQASGAVAIPIVVGWLVALTGAGSFVRYKSRKCGTSISRNGEPNDL